MEPCTERTLSEVMARVAFRLIEKDYHRHPNLYDEPTARLYRLSVTLEIEGFRALSMWVAAAAYHKTKHGGMLAQWRDRVIRRARLHAAYRRSGQPWRRAYDPPVSNTGVIGARLIIRGPLVPQKARWPNGPIR